MRRDGFIINNSSELINNIVLPQFQNVKGTDDGYKIRLEIENGLSKEKILKEKDAKLLKKFYIKVKKELDEVETD